MAETVPFDDQAAIRDAVARCAWALDTGDVEGFVERFCADGVLVWDVFETLERWEGAAALRHFAEFFRSQPTSAGRQHHVTNTVIAPCAQGARAMSYVTVALRQGHGPHLLNVMGYYDDLFRRDGGKWLLAERTIRDWSGPVLARIAGQTGERVARPMPPQLAGAQFRRPRE
ncbi:MAG: nuclear transport factor 2 family protein [Croceibacterium sp.]